MTSCIVTAPPARCRAEQGQVGQPGAQRRCSAWGSSPPVACHSARDQRDGDGLVLGEDRQLSQPCGSAGPSRPVLASIVARTALLRWSGSADIELLPGGPGQLIDLQAARPHAARPSRSSAAAAISGVQRWPGRRGSC